MAISKNKKRLQIVVDKALAEHIERMAKDNRKSVSAMSCYLLQQGCYREEGKGTRESIYNVKRN